MNFSTKFWNTARGYALNYSLNYMWDKSLIIAFRKHGEIVTPKVEYQTEIKNKLLKDLDHIDSYLVVTKENWNDLEYTPDVLLLLAGRTINCILP